LFRLIVIFLSLLFRVIAIFLGLLFRVMNKFRFLCEDDILRRYNAPKLTKYQKKHFGAFLEI